MYVIYVIFVKYVIIVTNVIGAIFVMTRNVTELSGIYRLAEGH